MPMPGKGLDCFTYAGLARVCVNVPPTGGFDVPEMLKRLHLQEALSKTDGDCGASISLEDADVDALVACVKSMRWGTCHADLVQFHDDVLALADQS